MDSGDKSFCILVGIAMAGFLIACAIAAWINNANFRAATEAGLHQQYVPGHTQPIWVPKEEKQ